MIGKLLVCTVVLLAACQAFAMRKTRTFCWDNSGGRRQMRDEWAEGDKLCKCVHPSSVYYFWQPGDPADAIKDCKLNGCFNPSGGPIFKEGDVYLDEQGRRCTCKAGTDPNLMDATTLFHTDCSNLILQQYEN